MAGPDAILAGPDATLAGPDATLAGPEATLGHIILIQSLYVVCLVEKQLIILVEKQLIILQVFCLIRPVLEPMIYHIRGEHANHYTTDAVLIG